MNTELSKEQILQTLSEQKELLHTRFYVTKIGLFGSFARNEANENSDIDFVVEFDAPLAAYIKNRYLLSDYLQSLFKRDVDLANPKSLKPFYKDEILNQAVYA